MYVPPHRLSRRSRGRLRGITAGLGLGLLLAAAGAGAGTLEVVVRDTAGHPLRGLPVSLTHGAVPSSRPFRVMPTNDRGQALFRDLSPDSYSVGFFHLPEPLLRPRSDPYSAAPAVTVRRADENLHVEIRLQRGIPVEVTANLNGEPSAVGQVLFRHRASGMELAAGFRFDGGRPVARRLLASGIWDVRVNAPPGLLLVGIDHGSTALGGYQAAVDLTLNPFPTDLTWHFVAPCTVEGTLSAGAGDPRQARVVAMLTEPGPWIDAVRERGGSKFQEVTADVDKNGTYRILVPDGAWRVTPVGDLESSSPPWVDLRLAPRDAGRADFHVTFADTESATRTESILMVHVNRADRSAPRPAGAQVEVYRPGTEEPVATEVVRTSWARILGLPEGDYLVSAHHPDFLEERAEVREFTADPSDTRHVNLTLSTGSAWVFEAADPTGRPLAGVEVDVERLDQGPVLLTRDPEFLAAKQRRQAVTDHSGRARMTGFYAGAYRVSAAIRGQARGVPLVDLSPRQAPEELLGPEIGVEIGDDEEVEVLVRQRPSSKLLMTLVCSDGWALPEAASVSVYDAFTWDEVPLADGSADEPVREADEPVREPVLHLRDVPLGGPLRDVLTVGPVPRGVYRVAVQPVGFERTTWAFETYEGGTANEVQVAPQAGQGLSTLDLGAFHLECGPAVDLVPEAAPGTPLPEIRRIRARIRLLDLEQKRRTGERATVTARGDRFEVRNLPRGKMQLDFTLSHPHFLPAPAVRWQVDVDLERGSFVEVAPYFEEVGGAVRVDSDRGTARLGGAGDRWIEVAVDAGRALFPSLVPAVYDVVLCGDAACDPPLRQWPGVQVTAGKTVVLKTGQ